MKRASEGGKKSTKAYRVALDWFPYLRRIYGMQPNLTVPTLPEEGPSEEALALQEKAAPATRIRTTRLWKRIAQGEAVLGRALKRLRSPFPLVHPCLVIGGNVEDGTTEALLAPLVADYRSLPDDAKQAAQLLGVAGRLANWLNTPATHKQAGLMPERLRWLLNQAGWSAMIVYTVALGTDPKSPKDQSAAIIAEAALLAHLGFVHAWCEHGRHHYFRPALGRRPDACVLHQKAARQSRWRASPNQRRKRVVK